MNSEIELKKIIGSLIFLAQKDKQLNVPNIAPRPAYEPRGFQGGGRNSSFDNRSSSRDRDRFGSRNNFGGNSGGRSGSRRNFEDRGMESSGDTKVYKIDVGAIHGLQAKNIVGAIANEAGIPSSNIGQIKIFDDYSTVKLPSNLGSAVINKLKSLRIMNLKSNMQEM